MNVSKMAGNVNFGKVHGMSDECHGKIIDTDININNRSSIPAISEKVLKSADRKSFSKRRSSCFNSLAVNAETRLGAAGVTDTSTEECIQKLKSEKEAWRAMYEERKQKYKTAKQRLNSEPLTLDWNNCAVVLLDEDKQFLSDQPDYEKTVSKINNVCEMASICMRMKHKSVHASSKITGMAEQQIASIKKKIFKHAEAYYT